MKFKDYINENKIINNEDDLIEVIKKNASQALKAFQKGHRIYRRTSKSIDNYFIMEPSGNRKSANTSNYYTLLFSKILKSWKKYPSRSKGIICSTDNLYAKEYGNLFYIFLSILSFTN